MLDATVHYAVIGVRRERKRLARAVPVAPICAYEGNEAGIPGGKPKVDAPV